MKKLIFLLFITFSFFSCCKDEIPCKTTVFIEQWQGASTIKVIKNGRTYTDKWQAGQPLELDINNGDEFLFVIPNGSSEGDRFLEIRENGSIVFYAVINIWYSSAQQTTQQSILYKPDSVCSR